VWLVIFLVPAIRCREIVPVGGPLYISLLILTALAWTLPYALDRLMASRVAGFMLTLI
jgi:hypothetical protein